MNFEKRISALESAMGSNCAPCCELNLTPEEIRAKYEAAGHCSEPVIVKTLDRKAVALNDLHGSDLAKTYREYLNG